MDLSAGVASVPVLDAGVALLLEVEGWARGAGEVGSFDALIFGVFDLSF